MGRQFEEPAVHPFLQNPFFHFRIVAQQRLIIDVRIPFARVDTDAVAATENCARVNEKLNTKMVNALFFYNRQQTEFYLLIACGDKLFRCKDFSSPLDRENKVRIVIG